MVLQLKPRRGGFLRPFGCGTFVRDFLMGKGPYGSPRIDPESGSPQSSIFYQYKMALIRATALDRATALEERRARRENRPIDPDNIEILIEKILPRIPYKTTACRFHSFVVYFSDLQKLEWVEATGKEEPSTFQDNYPPGPSRRFFRLTAVGRKAGDTAWANPHKALYGLR